MLSDFQHRDSSGISDTDHPGTPFLKWAGGKRQLLAQILPLVPEFDGYIEPFLGGGALYFALARSRGRFEAVLGDTNEELIDTYRLVRNDVKSLMGRLAEFERRYFNDPKAFYYNLRDNFTSSSKLDLSARFIALNRTCYNGLYRVNARGIFNVPMGKYKNPRICNKEILLSASRSLSSNVLIVSADYETTVSHARPGDFVYLDPPFSPESDTANFVSYTKYGFDLSQQKRLSNVFRALDGRGCKVMLSNSDTRSVRELYSDFEKNTIILDALRAINCKGANRSNHRELLICNYKINRRFQSKEDFS